MALRDRVIENTGSAMLVSHVTGVKVYCKDSLRYIPQGTTICAVLSLN
jgi:hypothetical protein